MTDGYKEYQRKRNRIQSNNSLGKSLRRTFFRQLSISLLILAAICGIKYFGSESLAETNHFIKSAFLYKPDTALITNTLNTIKNSIY